MITFVSGASLVAIRLTAIWPNSRASDGIAKGSSRSYRSGSPVRSLTVQRLGADNPAKTLVSIGNLDGRNESMRRFFRFFGRTGMETPKRFHPLYSNLDEFCFSGAVDERCLHQANRQHADVRNVAPDEEEPFGKPGNGSGRDIAG
jgi:hypothetical protein